MRGVGPQPEMGQDVLTHVRLVDKGDDAHGAPTPCTQQRIGLRDLLDQLGPALLEDRRARRRGNLDGACGRPVLAWLLCLGAFPPIDVAVPAIVADLSGEHWQLLVLRPWRDGA